MSIVQRNYVIGKRITAIDLQALRVPDVAHGKVTMHTPVFHLEDGSRIVFQVEEHPEAHFYGVRPIYIKAPRKRKRTP